MQNLFHAALSHACSLMDKNTLEDTEYLFGMCLQPADKEELLRIAVL